MHSVVLMNYSSQVVVQVDSRADDLLEAGKVAFEALGEREAADGMRSGAEGAESIQLEVGPNKNAVNVRRLTCLCQRTLSCLVIMGGFIRYQALLSRLGSHVLSADFFVICFLCLCFWPI